MLSDIEIAQKANLLSIKNIAASLGVNEESLELYGNYKAKFTEKFLASTRDKPNGKLVLVTAINPTAAGEGKTTTMVGLGQAMWKLDKKTIITIREPSMGPVFGIKGGAAGGGMAQVVPMEDINLHFTGDMHAVTSANNLLASMIDNHIKFGNNLGIDPTQILWKRCLDLNDRILRNVVVGLGGKTHGQPREDNFNITVASEVMAVLCLAEDLLDLKKRLGRIIVAFSYSGQPITARDLKADGAMTVLLQDAIKPNLVQTLENTPAIMHGGPFANIAHGCNSVRATKLALKLANFVLTEAGFGADLGAEKFLDIKCRLAQLQPNAIILVATTRALRYNGGAQKENTGENNLPALKRGFPNLQKHIDNLKQYGIPVIVALNSFESDSGEETNFIAEQCKSLGVDFAQSEVWAKGGKGGIKLAEKLIEVLETKKSNFRVLYDEQKSIKDKINIIATKIYGAEVVQYTPEANKQITKLIDIGRDNLPICIAKTQYSLSDDPAKLGCPTGFTITIRGVYLSAGAGFIVALAGDIMTMPGLPKKPAAEAINIDEDGKIIGLF